MESTETKHTSLNSVNTGKKILSSKNFLSNNSNSKTVVFLEVPKAVLPYNITMENTDSTVKNSQGSAISTSINVDRLHLQRARKIQEQSAIDLIKDLQKINVVIKNIDQIIDYLSKFQKIHSFIYNACIDICNQFNNNFNIYLDLEDEGPDGYILINVRQYEYEENFLNSLLEIGYKYIELTKNIDGKFRLITDYQFI